MTERNKTGAVVIWANKILITDRFSGPGIAISRVCVSVRTFERNDHLPRYLACWFNLTLCGWNSKVKVIGQSSWSRKENVVKVIGASSSEGFLIDVAFTSYRDDSERN